MKTLIDGLADLTGLRDHDALDFALTKLVQTLPQPHPVSVRLVRIVGESNDQRCMTCALLGAQAAEPQRGAAWMDWDTLPALVDFPSRQAAIGSGNIEHAATPIPMTVFPVGKNTGTSLLLEIETAQPLAQDVEGLIQSVLRVYKNLLGLLDYGEKDALTELLNRKTFDGAFFKAAADQDTVGELGHPDHRVYSAGKSYWLAVLDIDHFKRVNDNFGHLIGDEVLLLLAQLMRSNFRFHDQLYRFGGEEFVVLMRCADHSDAVSALERFRNRVESHPFPQVGTITISTGFAALADNDTPGGAFGRADKAVYYAKGHGRNQVCSYLALVKAGELVEPVVETNDVDLF